MTNPERDLLAETAKYSTRDQRQRMLIDVLDMKLDGYLQKFCDQIRQNKREFNENLRVRYAHWRIGRTELLVTYHEVKDVPGSAVYRLRHQPFKPDSTGDAWQDVMSFGEFENIIRQANKEKGYRPGDLKAQAKADIHRQNEPPTGLIMVGITGSTAYGLNHDGYQDPESGEWVPPSDLDVRGIFVNPTLDVLSLRPGKDLVQGKKGEDVVYDELGRFLELAAKSNPERIEMLASKKTFITPEGQLIVDNQDMFLSKRIKAVYGGYSQEQLKRIERNVDRKTKPAMHLIRLMITGTRILRTGVVDCDMSDYRADLLAIRTGEMPISDVFKWHRELEVDFAKAAAETKLPDEPDWNRINRVLQEIRLNHLIVDTDQLSSDAAAREAIKQLCEFPSVGVNFTK